VEPSSPPWRVFDASSVHGPAAGDQGATPAAAAGGLPIQPVALLGLFGAVALGIVAIVVAAAGMGSDRLVDGPGSGADSFASTDPHAMGSVLVVDVSGAVANPGLYRLAPGARVGDAIQAAGGYGPRVDVARVAEDLNLAATLSDGDRVHVPSRDDPIDGGDGTGGAGGAAGPGGGAGGLVDLNAASQSELEALPGIGPVTATKIIAAREEAPFRSIDELRERGLVGEKTFDSLKALVTVG
jgi:competence protein ComEA